MTVRELDLKDIPSVVEILQGSFEDRLRPFMIYMQHGIGRFLSVPLEYPGANSDRVPLVLVDRANILGFADFRILAGHTGFLSYVCVIASARGRGVATTLISEFLRRHPHVTDLSLDVFRGNGPAQALYTKIGFVKDHSVAWVTRALPAPRGSIAIDSLAASVAAYRQHGFCELSVRHQENHANVGLIGPGVVRCFSAESFANDSMLAGFRHVFEEAHTALAVIPEIQIGNIPVPHTVATLADRMTLTIR